MIEVIAIIFVLAMIGFFGGVFLDLFMSLLPYAVFGLFVVVLIWMLNGVGTMDEKLDKIEGFGQSVVEKAETLEETLERRYGAEKPTPVPEPELVPQDSIRIINNDGYTR